jgi:hypothetical protein
MTSATHSMEGSGATVRVLYLGYSGSVVTIQKILDMTGSLQWKMTGKLSTLYWIWPDHS